ncbi:MAG: FkbM family methyltransferase [Deltaproteobacteria bacterium]|nr:FkbM family methyltransferase [Deltaproteobacteria bacterium]
MFESRKNTSRRPEQIQASQQVPSQVSMHRSLPSAEADRDGALLQTSRAQANQLNGVLPNGHSPYGGETISSNGLLSHTGKSVLADANSYRPPNALAAVIKSPGRILLESLDRTGLRGAGLMLARAWVNFRDRNVPAEQRIEIGRHLESWFVKQGELFLTFTKLQWGPTPENAIKETESDLFWRYAPKPGDTVVSIGAGTGLDVLCAARRVAASGKVVAIEAHPKTFSALTACCELNKLKNVERHQFAVSDRDGIEYIEDGRSSLSNSIVRDRGSIAVKGVTFDSLVRQQGIEKVDLLLMNIEGAERAAIRGMERSIANVRHACICCHDFRADRGDGELMRTISLVMHFLRQHGFNVFTRPNDPRPWVRCNVYGEKRPTAARSERLVEPKIDVV